MKRILIYIAFLCGLQAAGQTPLETVLAAVESGNLELKAAREQAEARKAEARAGNTLPDPTVGYDYLWGNSRAVGNTGELNVVQGFELPNVYASRSRYARSQGAQFDAEYAALRQNVLLQAQQSVIGVGYLNARAAILRQTGENARRLAAAYGERMAAGDASLPDRNRTEVEAANADNDQKANSIELEAALALLSELCGGNSPLAASQFVAGPLPALPALDAATALWEQNHPVIAVSAAATAAAGQQVKVRKGEALPRFEVGYRGEYAAAGERFDGIKMGMSIPIFESRHTVKKARAEQAAAMATEQGARQRAAIEVRRLHARAAMLLDSYRSSAGALEKAGDRNLARRAFEAGHISLEEYYARIASVNLLEDTKLGLERDYRLAVAELLAPEL
jgi:outer membrane protein TolC